MRLVVCRQGEELAVTLGSIYVFLKCCLGAGWGEELTVSAEHGMRTTMAQMVELIEEEGLNLEFGRT